MESVNSYNDKIAFTTKMKAIGCAIKNNGASLCVLGAMIGSLVFSGCVIAKTCKSVVSAVNMISFIVDEDESLSQNNDAAIQNLMKDSIVVANAVSTVEQDYYFEDSFLYDKDGNVVSLENEDRDVVFFNCKLDSTTLENIDLASSNVTSLDLSSSNIDDKCINSLPSTLETLDLSYCNYITNLNGLGMRCPNIKRLAINNAASLSDLSFIYELPNLEELYMTDNAYVTNEILDYLTRNNITTNLSERDVINSQLTDNIINEIITEGMTDREKVQAICVYVLELLEYDISTVNESNDFPLTTSLESGKVVCASYAYLTNVLFNKAGIISYKVGTGDHCWNLIILDGNYYYIDTTNMDDDFVNELLLNAFNIAKNYMVDPSYTALSSMESVSSEEADIMINIIDDVVRGSSNKDIIEKYGSVVLSGALKLLNLITAIFVAFNLMLLRGGEVLDVFQDTMYCLKYDYSSFIRRERWKNNKF